MTRGHAPSLPLLRRRLMRKNSFALMLWRHDAARFSICRDTRTHIFDFLRLAMSR